MSVIKATDVTYDQLIAQPGLTLVMYDDTRTSYRNQAKLRAAFRAKARGSRMQVVLFDDKVLTVDPGRLAYLPTFRMYRDGERIAEWEPPRDRSHLELAWWADSFLPEEERASLGRIVYRLAHGIELDVREIREPVPIVEIANFLAEAMRHFKRHRDVLKVADYTNGSFWGVVRPRRRAPALCQIGLYHPGDKDGLFLTASQWVDAVIAAYTATNTLEEIVQDLQNYREAVAREPRGWLTEVVEKLTGPHGEFLALRVMLDADRAPE